MSSDKKAIGDPIKNFAARGGRLGGNKEKPQQDSGKDVQPDRDTDAQTKKSSRMKTGYSLDRKLIKQAKQLALDEDKDMNDIIEEGLRLVFADRKRRAGEE